MPLQHTIRSSASLEGVGLHTGETTTVTINPAPEYFGIRFVRTDIPKAQEIKADIDNVTDLAKGTTIEQEGVKIHTVEHLMSAFAGMSIDNCLVQVSGTELPLMDGSALPFVKMIQEAEIVEQAAQREYISLDEPMLLYEKDDVAYGFFPSDHFHITLMTDYGHRHPAVGAQHTAMFSLKDYATEYAPARTFCFLSEIEKLREKGLIKGGSLDSAVVVQDVELTKDHIEYIKKLFNEKHVVAGENGLLNNTELRFPNELCRHKALDLIGDLYLLGKPFLGHIQAARTSHASNIAMAKKIRERINKKKSRKPEKPPVSFEEIMELLPHRYPFLLVDGVEKIDPEKSIVAFKNVSFNDNFFQGHFPGNPIMPGVLQIEAMAQAGGIMSLFGKKVSKDSTILFLAVDKVRWRGIVRPGDKLRIECVMLQNRRNTIRFAGKCFVGDQLVSEAELMAMLGKKE